MKRSCMLALGVALALSLPAVAQDPAAHQAAKAAVDKREPCGIALEGHSCPFQLLPISLQGRSLRMALLDQA